VLLKAAIAATAAIARTIRRIDLSLNSKEYLLSPPLTTIVESQRGIIQIQK
jgi:hypothetical protein